VEIPKSVDFKATLPTGRSAISFTGEGAAKISLDCDAEEIGEVIVMLLGMRGKLLKVSVEVVPE